MFLNKNSNIFIILIPNFQNHEKNQKIEPLIKKINLSRQMYYFLFIHFSKHFKFLINIQIFNLAIK